MPDPSLHHVGYVVASIEECVSRWREILCAVEQSPVFEDPIQGARVTFFRTSASKTTQIELVEPLGDRSTVAAFKEKVAGCTMCVSR